MPSLKTEIFWISYDVTEMNRSSSVKYKNEIMEFYLFNYVHLCNKFGRAKMRRLYANVCKV